jgi:hypothetical protein
VKFFTQFQGGHFTENLSSHHIRIHICLLFKKEYPVNFFVDRRRLIEIGLGRRNN